MLIKSSEILENKALCRTLLELNKIKFTFLNPYQKVH